MVLTGLAVAHSVIIGGAVIDVVSIRRRLREHRQSGGIGSASTVVAGTSAAVRGPLTFGALIVLVAPVPFLFVQGAPGFFSRPAVLAYVLAVTASSVVALTVTPALALMLLRNEPLGHRPSRLARWSDRLFAATVPPFVRRPGWAYAMMALLLVMACAAVPQLQGRSLFASPHDRTLLIQVATVSGTSLPEMERITKKLSQELRSVRGVRQVGAHVGRAVTGDQVVNVNSGELWVSLADSASHDATAAAVRRVLDGYPGVRSDLLSYPEERVRAAQARTKSGLVVRVYGQDLDVLRSKAEEIRTRLSTVQGVVRPRVQAQAQEPTLVVEVNLAAAQRYGLNPGDVRRTAATFYSGLLVGNLYEEQKVFDVVVQGVPSTHSTLNVADLLVEVPAGGYVRLGDIAKVQVAPYPTVIRHDAASRSLDVTAEVSGWDLGAVLREVGKRVRSVRMPVEYRAEVLSDLAEQQSQDIRVAAVAVAAAIAIFLLLQAAFSSWRLAALVFLTLPLAAAGGVVTALATGGIMTLGAVAGLFTVLGVAAPSIILLVRGYQSEDAGRGTDPNAASVLGATREAAGPIVLTAWVTGIVLLPLLLLGGVAGTEVLHPLAAVVLGGLVSSTLVALFLVPSLYLRLSPAPRAGRPRTRTAADRPRHQQRTSQAVTD
jgi:Cu/Ag efflux pump CusA